MATALYDAAAENAGDDAVELAIKLRYASRRLEESESLALRLRQSLAEAVERADALQARCATLKAVQDGLLADKLTAERRVEALTREKGLLAAEAGALRAAAKDERRQQGISSLADDAVAAAAAAAAAGGAGAGAGAAAAAAAASAAAAVSGAAGACEGGALRAARGLVMRLLEACHRHGIEVSLAELTAAAGGDAALGAGAGAAAAAEGAALARAELAETLASSWGLGEEFRRRRGSAGQGAGAGGSSGVGSAAPQGPPNSAAVPAAPAARAAAAKPPSAPDAGSVLRAVASGVAMVAEEQQQRSAAAAAAAERAAASPEGAGKGAGGQGSPPPSPAPNTLIGRFWVTLVGESSVVDVPPSPSPRGGAADEKEVGFAVGPAAPPQ